MKVTVVPNVNGGLQMIGSGTGTWKNEDEWRPFKQQHCGDWPEY